MEDLQGKKYIIVKQLQAVGSRNLNNENKKKIMEVFSSPVGKRLIWSMLLIQPISARELKQILPFSLAVFNPHKKLTSEFPDPNHADKIPAIVNVLNILRQSEPDPPENAFFKSIFSDKDLYGNTSILKKAEECKLVLAVPRKKGIKTDKYYFLNSNLEFKLLPDGKTEIVENAPSVQTLCKFDNFSSYIWPELKRKNTMRRELIIAPGVYNNAAKDEKTLIIYTNFGRSVGSLFNTLSWSSEHYNELKKLWNLHNESNGKFGKFIKIENIKRKRLKWCTDLFRRALREKIILESSSDRTMCSFVQSVMINVPFRLGGSYDILKCFTKSNNKFDPSLSPIGNIKYITRKNYEINPLQRSKVFSSLVERHPGSLFVIRNSQLIGNIFSSLFLNSEFHGEFLRTLREETGYNKLLSCFPG